MIPVQIIPVGGDNYSYLVPVSDSEFLCVDPTGAGPVESALKGGKLCAILATHHHFDHVGGVEPLKKKFGCKVFGGDKRISGIDEIMGDGQKLRLGDLEITALTTPGHTSGGISFLVEAGEEKAVFTGDTLFVGGCGRLFECDAKTMWDSLQKLAGLDENTKVYCGHEYTVENFDFACEVMPKDGAFQKAADQAGKVVRQGGVTVPSTIGQEKQWNIFLRAGEPAVQETMKMQGRQAFEVFGRLRPMKDRF